MRDNRVLKGLHIKGSNFQIMLNKLDRYVGEEYLMMHFDNNFEWASVVERLAIMEHGAWWQVNKPPSPNVTSPPSVLPVISDSGLIEKELRRE